jgi:DNA-binding XRE family transcriptional regulator
MKHRNINTEEWSRMAIDSLFERGQLPDWREFADALRGDVELARETLFMCERHENKGSAALARTLAEHFHPGLLSAETGDAGKPL